MPFLLLSKKWQAPLSLLVHLRMTQLVKFQIAISFFLWLLLHVMVEGNSIPKVVQQNVTVGSSSSSPWLKKIMNQKQDPRSPGCGNRPWICRQGESRPGMRCCRNRCVDVFSDVNNCGLCGIRCPFSWQCCRSLCADTNINPFNCGKCGNRCPFGVLCLYGMCGYAQAFPPLPFPRPPPRPPFPFPPKPPRPQPWPRPPFPFPPKPQPWHPPHLPTMQWSYFDNQKHVPYISHPSYVSCLCCSCNVCEFSFLFFIY